MLVDDDSNVRRALRTTLASAGYTVVEARSGEEAIEEIQADGAVNMILLDLKMPGMGGIEASRKIRKISDVPILVISVLRTQEEKVQAFDAGADDYLVKPFGIQELLSRIHALRRRVSGSEPVPPFESGELKIDFERRRVTLADQPVHLTPSEFELLRYLVLNEGKPVAHHTLLQSLWGPEHVRDVQRLRVTINQLRRKIELEPDRIRYIHTEHQFGYRFEPTPQKSVKRRAKP
ncbi:MAG TPA: response regulator transcription factor [Candidatus Acidoferrales bacterium]|nr:response regulator transcription factor [Candidatus Acidoferrales bacterium]